MVEGRRSKNCSRGVLSSRAGRQHEVTDGSSSLPGKGMLAKSAFHGRKHLGMSRTTLP